MLPKIDGYKVCGLLKADKRFKQMPIIIFSARGEETEKIIGKEVGADLYFDKGTDFSLLVNEIKKLI